MVIFSLYHSYIISQDSMVRFSSSLFNYLSILLVGRTNGLLFYSFTLHLLSLFILIPKFGQWEPIQADFWAFDLSPTFLRGPSFPAQVPESVISPRNLNSLQ